MLRYLYGDSLQHHPKLANGMFRDRAAQFQKRLGWAVNVDADGFERDEYDALNPLYVIWECADGSHGGSMRFLPTTGPVMVNDHFGQLTSGVPIVSPLIWECTRFCLAPQASRQVAAALMQSGGEITRGFGVRHFVGVFDARMVRIYKRIGAAPEILGSEGQGRDRISVGLWSFDDGTCARTAQGSGISQTQSRRWFDLAFGARPAARRAQAG